MAHRRRQPKPKPSLDTLTDKKAAAIDGYLEWGTVRAACVVAGISRQTWYNWVEADPDFAQQVKATKEQVGDGLEEEAIRRAKDGSDTLLIFLLKGHKPQYRDRFIHTGEGGGPIEHQHTLTDAELVKEIAQLFAGQGSG